MRICMTQKRPRFEVMQWPADELEWWSVYFSIEDKGDKDVKSLVAKRKAETTSVEESKRQFEALMW